MHRRGEKSVADLFRSRTLDRAVSLQQLVVLGGHALPLRTPLARPARSPARAGARRPLLCRLGLARQWPRAPHPGSVSRLPPSSPSRAFPHPCPAKQVPVERPVRSRPTTSRRPVSSVSSSSTSSRARRPSPSSPSRSPASEPSTTPSWSSRSSVRSESFVSLPRQAIGSLSPPPLQDNERIIGCTGFPVGESRCQAAMERERDGSFPSKRELNRPLPP